MWAAYETCITPIWCHVIFTSGTNTPGFEAGGENKWYRLLPTGSEAIRRPESYCPWLPNLVWGPGVLCYRSWVKRQSAVLTCELREQRDGGCSAVTPPASRHHLTLHSGPQQLTSSRRKHRNIYSENIYNNNIYTTTISTQFISTQRQWPPPALSSLLLLTVSVSLSWQIHFDRGGGAATGYSFQVESTTLLQLPRRIYHISTSVMRRILQWSWRE